MNPKPLFEPNDSPMNVICLGSGTGSTLEALLDEQSRQEPEGIPRFRIRAVLVNKECRCIEIANTRKLPLIYNSRVLFFKARNRPPHDTTTAEEYDRKNLHDLQQVARENRFTIDLIALTGYSSILHKSFVSSFHDKIINSHPADLSIRNSKGERVFAGSYGSNSVLQALIRGERSTKTSIHLVTSEVDAGEILVTSKSLQFPSEVDEIRFSPDSTQKESALKTISQRHQDLQKVKCDYPAYITAMNLIASGRLSLGEGDEIRPLFLDGKILPYEGVDLDGVIL